MRRGMAIKNLLNKVEDDFGFECMIHVFMRTSKQLGHDLGPLDARILEKLISIGFQIKNVHKILQYNKNITTNFKP